MFEVKYNKKMYLLGNVLHFCFVINKLRALCDIELDQRLIQLPGVSTENFLKRIFLMFLICFFLQ